MPDRYATEIAQGAAAYAAEELRKWNPHVWQSLEWWAWDAGWASAEREGEDAEECGHDR